MKTTPKKNGGFTLVELIVVIAILAILAAVAIPAYSGYIEKAEEANDLQLLGALNTAFNAACVENGVSILDMDNATNGGAGSAEFVLSNGLITKLKVPGASASVMTTAFTADQAQAILDSFMLYFGENKTTPFKVYVQIVFADGAFEGKTADEVVLTGAYLEILEILTNGDYDEAIADLKGSAFNEMGYDILAGKIDNASSLLAGFYGNSASGFHQLLDSEENVDVLYSYLSDDYDKAGEIFDGMLEVKLNEIYDNPKYAGLSDRQKGNLAYGQLYANAAILTAAKNPNAVDSDFITALENGNAVSLLQSSTNGGAASSDTIAQAAFAYAMYTSYQNHAGNKVTTDVNINDVYATLGTTEFQTYMKNNSTADQEGYFGAMALISGSAENADSDLAKDILQNGFNSYELIALINGATAG